VNLDYLAKDGNYPYRGIMPWPECARAKASPLFSLLGQLQLHILDRAYNQNYYYINSKLQGQAKYELISGFSSFFQKKNASIMATNQ
jgi:hypothetical protein